MIIEEMTLRVKNILFFKAVCITISIISLTYLIDKISTDTIQTAEKYSKAKEMLSNVMERFNAINKQSEDLAGAITKYQNLKKIASSHIDDDCFNKEAYEKSINNAATLNGLKDPATIFISSGLENKMNQRTESIFLKTTNIKLQYHLDSFLTAVTFARNAYNSLPIYSTVKNMLIEKHVSLTPSLVNWLTTANEPDLTITTINMEVRELSLNEQ